MSEYSPLEMAILHNRRICKEKGIHPSRGGLNFYRGGVENVDKNLKSSEESHEVG